MLFPIGYIPLNKDGTPYRTMRSGYHKGPANGYHPPRVYQNKKTAENQSPCGEATEVFVRHDENSL